MCEINRWKKWKKIKQTSNNGESLNFNLKVTLLLVQKAVVDKHVGLSLVSPIQFVDASR